MFTRNFLSGVPFVLCSLLAPDAGGAAGGGAADKPKDPKTLAEAISMLGVARDESSQASARATKAEAESKRVNGQFASLVQMAKANTTTIVDLRAKVSTHETTISGHVATIDRQKKDVERLEGLCVGAGIDFTQAVTPAIAPEPTGAEERAELVKTLEEAKGPQAKGEAAAKLRAFDAKAKAAAKAA